MNISRFRLVVLALVMPWLVHGQTVNSGSDGSDGTFHPTTDTVINMADHPDGIYHYTSVNIPAGVTVRFTPNAKNTPVVWLVQGECLIAGTISVSANPNWSGSYNSSPIAKEPGPGGFAGGNGGTAANPGQGPGGGNSGSSNDGRTVGGNGSYATAGNVAKWGAEQAPFQSPSGAAYGNQFLVPLLGGSGGGGNAWGFGGGGGGAILIAVSGTLTISGSLLANGSQGGQASTAYVNYPTGAGGAGSGGAVRLVASHLRGTGNVSANGGSLYAGDGWGGLYTFSPAGNGRVRFDTLDNTFSGIISGSFSQGFQPIILPIAGQSIQLAIASVAGGSVPANPSSSPANPAVIVPAQQAGLVPVVVQCFNVPLNTPITVTARPANGAVVSASGFNSSGTTAASTATVNLNLPRGSGILMAKATVAVAQGASGGLESPPARERGFSNPPDIPIRSAARLADLPLSVTGLTTDGERIAAVEVEATLGGGSRTVYVTESGKRIPAPSGK